MSSKGKLWTAATEKANSFNDLMCRILWHLNKHTLPITMSLNLRKNLSFSLTTTSEHIDSLYFGFCRHFFTFPSERCYFRAVKTCTVYGPILLLNTITKMPKIKKSTQFLPDKKHFWWVLFAFLCNKKYKWITHWAL